MEKGDKINKLKVGIISFFFSSLLGFSLMSFNELRYSLRDFLSWVSLIVIFSIVLIVLLLISISKAEKRILEDTYSSRWVLKFSLISFVILIVVLFGLLIALLVTFNETNAESLGFFFIYSVIAIPIISLVAILLLSVTPSLILHKFYSNKKVFSTISWIFICLSILLVVYLITINILVDFPIIITY